MIRILLPASIMVVTGLALLFRIWKCRKQHRPIWKTKIFIHEVTFCVFLFFRILTLLTLLRALALGHYDHVFLCMLSLLLFVVPALLEKPLKVELPSAMEIIILCFIFAAEILGEINNYYVNVGGWDTMLHTANGFLCAAIGFALVDLLNRSERTSLKLSPAYLGLAASCFSMTIGVLWEFFGFSMDYFWRFDMQKDYIVTAFSSVNFDLTNSNIAVPVHNIVRTTIETANGKAFMIDGYLDIGIIDTMKDLLVNFLGATIFSAIGYFHMKSNGKGKFAKQFIPLVKAKGDEIQP